MSTSMYYANIRVHCIYIYILTTVYMYIFTYMLNMYLVGLGEAEPYGRRCGSSKLDTSK